MSDLYIGVMSGTSVDGIDVALVDFEGSGFQIINTHYVPYEHTIREKILALSFPSENEIRKMAELDLLLSKAYVQAILQLLAKSSCAPHEIKAIGCHGQTIAHYPDPPLHFTLQLGNPNVIATETGIITVADFRRKDIACGGQGAPLVPAFHHYLFKNQKKNIALINVGGIANITILNSELDEIVGFDIGPGNVLIDAWINHTKTDLYDEKGKWAAQGNILDDLLAIFLSDNYFSLPPPKSTGREYFNLTWIHEKLKRSKNQYEAVDIQTTLTALTSRLIYDEVKKHFAKGEILICGGGFHNNYLMSYLRKLAKDTYQVSGTNKYGIDPDQLEAITFAWLAKQTMMKLPGNIPSVTGAKRPTVLGGIYYAS